LGKKFSRRKLWEFVLFFVDKSVYWKTLLIRFSGVNLGGSGDDLA